MLKAKLITLALTAGPFALFCAKLGARHEDRRYERRRPLVIRP